MLDSSPLANKNLLKRKAPAHLEDPAHKTTVLPSPPDTSGDGKASKQGVTAPAKPRPKKRAQARVQSLQQSERELLPRNLRLRGRRANRLRKLAMLLMGRRISMATLTMRRCRRLSLSQKP